MRLTFDKDQSHQVEAIEAVARVFLNQQPTPIGMTRGLGGLTTEAVPNVLSLTDQQLLENLRAVQGENSVGVDDELKRVSGTADRRVNGGAEKYPVAFPNVSVEMETGTGKTYTYLRTAYELCQRYGFRKFIIVVPSVAIREGVKKTLEITEDHFRALYPQITAGWGIYSADSLYTVWDFATSDTLEFLVMTIDSFNKDTSVMRRPAEELFDQVPLELLQDTRPILILDEPQNMESELRKAALAQLNPLTALRYSATHRDPYNLVYRLTPYDAYELGLVKRIEVASALSEHDANAPFVRVAEVAKKGTSYVAKLAVHKLHAKNVVKEVTLTVKQGDNLRDKTGLG